MPFNVNPNSNQGQEQENTGSEPVDLGQSRYDFRYLVFPNDLGMDDNGHYMVININVPTKGFFGNVGAAFPSGFDYTFILDAGYKIVPSDVQKATQMLIVDIQNNANDYYRRFVSEYSTDQFDLKCAPQFLRGTGNNIVDKILDNYKGNVINPGLV